MVSFIVTFPSIHIKLQTRGSSSMDIYICPGRLGGPRDGDKGEVRRDRLHKVQGEAGRVHHQGELTVSSDLAHE